MALGEAEEDEESDQYEEDRFADGPALEAKFFLPCGIFKMTDGALMIADTYNNRIRRLDFREIINAYTRLAPVKEYLMELYVRDKAKAFVTLANMVPSASMSM